MEEVNKGVQHWIPAIPRQEHWKAACANYSKLKDLRKKTLDQLDVKDPRNRTAKPSTDIHEQVDAYRTHVRSTGYLLHPEVDQDHVSITGEKLDPELV